MESLKNTSHTKMCIPTPEIPLGVTRLENVGMLKVCIGKKDPGGEYIVTSETDEVLFTSTETLRELENGCGGKSCNAFYLELIDAMKQQMISLQLLRSVYPKMQVRVNGILVAVVRQYPTFRKPVLLINDARDQQVLRIKGPATFKGKCDFDLHTLNKQSIGVISKLWGHHQVKRSVEDYKIIFPKDLDVNFKVAVLVACFLIDFLCIDDSWF